MKIVAYVKMGQIKATLGKALAYIARDDATRGGVFVSTNAAVIDPSDHNAVAAMMQDTSSAHGHSEGKGSVLAHHVIQSFDPAEKIDAETAHRIGVELAEGITGGSHEYMIATHVDKDHVHNHIIFNATNFETGRKFRCQRDTLRRVRTLSDGLCLRAGLSVMDEPKQGATGRSLADIYLVVKGQSHKRFLQTEIDKATQFARSFDDVEKHLRLAGVEVSRRQGSLSFRAENQRRAVRDFRLGAAFTEAGIMARLARQSVNRVDVDRSMIVDEDSESIRVRVPGSRGQLHLTLARNQVVQHGRTLRAYIPANGDHVLSDRSGRFARSVDTAALYSWFSKPVEKPARVFSIAGIDEGLVRAARGKMSALRAAQDRVNAMVRWAPEGHTAEGLARAREALETLRVDYQAHLVAASEALDNPSIDGDALRGLGAALRNSERQVVQLQKDVTALETALEPTTSPSAAEGGTGQHEGATMKERIEDAARARARQRELDSDDLTPPAEPDLVYDAEVPQQLEPVPAREDSAQAARVAELRARLNRQINSTGTAESVEDSRRDLVQTDGDGDPTNTSTNRLETRIAERAEAMRRESDSRDEPTEERKQKWHR